MEAPKLCENGVLVVLCNQYLKLGEDGTVFIEETAPISGNDFNECLTLIDLKTQRPLLTIQL